jgi:hypothetical protein
MATIGVFVTFRYRDDFDEQAVRKIAKPRAPALRGCLGYIPSLHDKPRKAQGNELLRLGLRGRGHSVFYRRAFGARNRSLRRTPWRRVRSDCHAGGERSRVTPLHHGM